MQVIRAKTAGFCMGVSLALQKLEKALEKHGNDARICTLGPIIHNPQVLAHFSALGVACLDAPDDASAEDRVLIRAHGIPLEMEAGLRARCSSVEDATCPKVKTAQLSIGRATDLATLLLFGEADHPEVRGLVSYARNDARVFDSLEQLADLDPGKAYVLASQTTQDREAFGEISSSLAARLPRLAILSTICDATRERQQEALRIASEVEIMVVAGGRQSGNTRRLANISADAGIKTFHVEELRELRPEDFAGCKKVGLTAGASTPKKLIDDVEKWLNSL